MILTRKSRLTSFVAISVLLLTAGCAVGPQFKRPAAPTDGGYTATPLSTTSSTTNVAGGEAQQFVEARDIPGEWWTLFQSKPLSDLIERSLKANPDIKAAASGIISCKRERSGPTGCLLSQCYGRFFGEPIQDIE